MSNLRTAAQQALEFVTSERWGTTPYMDVRVYEDAAKLRDALRAALAQPEPTVPSDCADSHQPVAWADADADADAARLAMELEALLLSCKDTAAVSRWWDSAHDALDLHRQRLSMDGLANQQKTFGSPCPTCEALARAVMMDQTGKA